MVSLAGYTANSPRSVQLSQRISFPSRLPSHLFQHFIDDATVNKLVQIRHWLSLGPAEFRRDSRFEKVFDQIRRHFGAVLESPHRVCLDSLMSRKVPPKRGMWTY